MALVPRHEFLGPGNAQVTKRARQSLTGIEQEVTGFAQLPRALGIGLGGRLGEGGPKRGLDGFAVRRDVGVEAEAGEGIRGA